MIKKDTLTIFLITILLLAGCTSPQVPESKNCLKDKECLKAAFLKCENAYGTWEGNNGDIEVKIIEKKNEKCLVQIIARETKLSITNKTIICNIPITANTIFSISSDCSGELKDYFDEE